MNYRREAASPEGLVQLLAANYLRHGYWFYVSGRLKKNKDGAELDEKLLAKYSIAVSARERARRKRSGIANMHYVRFDSWFILLCTAGHHRFWQEERTSIQDCRRIPIKFEGYSISYRRGGRTAKGEVDEKWHAHVRIDQPTYKQLKAFFVDRALHRSAKNLAKDFASVPYARYAPVRRQLLNILRAVNKARNKHSFEPLPHSVLQLRRTPVSVYKEGSDLRQIRQIQGI